MIWSVLDPSESLRRLRAGARGLDVRSEGEFAHGALPGFVNVPVLDDRHRHLVGLTYKQRGPSAAVALGRELVEPRRIDLIERWSRALAESPAERRLVVCWRGGLRSSSVADALASAGVEGFRVDGGYKALRGELLRRLDDPPPVLVLTGFTGSGKTELLKTVPRALDLEAFANHRGSAFGADLDAVQPSQQTFENALAFALLDACADVVVEDESAMIGRLMVPHELRRRMASAPVVIVDVPREERARRSFRDYVLGPVVRHGRLRVRDHLVKSLNAVASRLGGLRLRELTEAIDAGFAAPELDFENFEAPITRLLKEYYDPSYLFGLERAARPIEFRGTPSEVTEFLKSRSPGDPAGLAR